MSISAKNIELNDQGSRDIIHLLHYIEQDAATSRDCLAQGVMTRTAQNIETFLSNPVQSLLDSYSSIGKGIKGIAEGIIQHFLNFNKPVIYKVYKNPDTLSYYIAFQEDTFEVRERFFNFLQQYEELEFAANFPVFFQFVSQRIADKQNIDNQVLLIDAETH